MIIEEKVKDLVVVGEDTSKKARISQNKLAKLQYLLTKGLYKDPITAVIAEWTNNGIDSVVQAGKDPVEHPVLVKINKDIKGQYTFRVEDKGTGLDDSDFENICMNYLESTKEGDNDTIGHFGIGMKSFLALERAATFTCIKNGIERRYLVYEGSEFVNYDLIYEKPTTEENGVIAEVAITGWSERNQFVEKSRVKLSYYDTAVLIVDGQIQKNEIYRNELFQWSTSAKFGGMHISLKDVYYPIDWEALGIPVIPVPIAIRLNLGDGLTPTPSRESYITNEKTKKLLLAKIEEIADWFVDKYNETVKNFKTFMAAYDYLGDPNLYVRLQDKEFKINPLVKYTRRIVALIKVDGIKMRNPNDYKINRDELLYSYSIAGYVSHNGSVKVKRIGTSIEHHVFSRRQTILVSSNLRGNVREFLKQKYGSGTLFVRDNGLRRELGKVTYDQRGNLQVDSSSYRHVLGLGSVSKALWRNYITEWEFVVSSIVSTFIDETKVEDSPEFAEWLEDKKEEQREKRKLMNQGRDYEGLGKKQGDVTLAYSYPKYGKTCFAKKAYPIARLHKNDFLTVLITKEDNLDLAKGIAYVFKNNLYVRFALVGNKEIKKIPEHFQFINFQRFMSRDCKPFMRLASAIKFDELLESYDNISEYGNVVFKQILSTLNSDAEVLRKYVEDNLKDGIPEDLKNIIIDAADANRLYDEEKWDIYKRLQKELEKYDFIDLIDVPKSTNNELTKRYQRLINQILLFRKKFYDDLPEGAKIVFEEVKTETNEVV